MTLIVHSVEDVSTGVALRKRVSATYQPSIGETISDAFLAEIDRVRKVGHETTNAPILRCLTKREIDIVWIFVYESEAAIGKRVAEAIAYFVKDGLDPRWTPASVQGRASTTTHRRDGGIVTISLHREWTI